MTAKELIMNGKDKVRRDSSLMHLYLDLFKQAFNEVPNCASCSFSRDWNRFCNFYKDSNLNTYIKVNTMQNIKIKKIQGNILSYKKDGKTYRLYDNILTDSFISEYLTNGTEEEISERKKLFNFPIIIEDSSNEVDKETLPVKRKRRKRIIE